MKVKVCGIKSVEQMRQLESLGVDYAGMIFYPHSKRYVGELSTEEKEAFRQLRIKKIGVFVNADFETVLAAIKDYDLYAVQLHGDETDEYCLELMDKVKVVKVFRIADQQNIEGLTTSFAAVCHYFLFDTDTAQYGGSGKQFDWNILAKAKMDKPFFLSGGIGLEDVEKLKNFSHPSLHAVDVNSRLETAPGVKDMEKVRQFIEELKTNEWTR